MPENVVLARFLSKRIDSKSFALSAGSIDAAVRETSAPRVKRCHHAKAAKPRIAWTALIASDSASRQVSTESSTVCDSLILFSILKHF